MDDTTDDADDQTGHRLAEDDQVHVVDRILDAAMVVYEAEGVDATTMAQVAAAAGCPLTTLYAHYATRLALQLAVMQRSARLLDRQLAAELDGLTDRGGRFVTAITWALRQVRTSPTLAAWFDVGDGRVASQLIQDSPEILAMAASELGDLTDPDVRRRARWVVRLIVSLLTFPGADDADERALIERFLVPVVLDGVPPGPVQWPASAEPAPRPGEPPAPQAPSDDGLMRRILDAALVVFEADGLAEADLESVAAAAGCSLADLHDHFPDRDALRLALVDREGEQNLDHVYAELATVADPADRALEAGVLSLRAVRSAPLLAGWYEHDDARVASDLLLRSGRLRAGLAGFLGDPHDPDVVRRAHWYLRVFTSLLTYPGLDDADERMMLERFVVPVVA